MTYCLGIALTEGIVFCSDSRTNAGPDRVNTYSKMHSFFFEGDRSITLLSAGNLATSQSVIAKLNRDLEGAESITIRSGKYVSDVADYVGELLVAARSRYASE
ncbi:MAG: peptidase, partial [Gammaproteobacteria bacterium]|nr:peptidase [Gammaproteobacteria bacterium]